MNTVFKAIRDLGLDPSEITLQGTLRHIPAGTKDHYASGEVQVFEPALTTLNFMHPSQPIPMLTWRNNGQEMTDPKAYWSHLETGPGIDADEARQLVTEFIERHRDLTGEMSDTYSKIENDPVHIQAILAASEVLEIKLAPLVRYVEIEDAIFDDMLHKLDPAVMDALHFEKFSLTPAYRKKPCDFDLFTQLRREYVSSDHIGLGMNHYYNWFRKSEALFDETGSLTQAAKDEFDAGLTAWATAENNVTPEKLQDKQKMARHNFRVHPRHALLIDEHVREIVLAHALHAAQKLRETSSLRPT